jgi:hypothetical protein
MLGVFDCETDKGNLYTYEEFITQGAKKYAYTKYKKLKKVNDNDNVLKIEGEKALVLNITVSGVPKKRKSCN